MSIPMHIDCEGPRYWISENYYDENGHLKVDGWRLVCRKCSYRSYMFIGFDATRKVKL